MQARGSETTIMDQLALKRMRVYYTNTFDKNIIENLSKSDLKETFFFVQLGLNLCDSRFELLKEKIQSFRNLILNQKPPGIDTSKEVIRTQIQQLDLISSTFMFLEEYLVYSYNLRKQLDNFHDSLASRNDKVPNCEIKFLRALGTIDEIKKYMLYDKASFNGINCKLVEFLKQKIDYACYDIMTKVKHVISFYDSYNRIYVKFKHTLSAVIGVYHKEYIGIVKSPMFGIALKAKINSFLIISDLNNNMKSTFLLPTSLNQLNYYEETVYDIHRIFSLLMYAYLNYMANSKSAFLPPIDIYMKDNKERTDWKKMTNRNRNYIDQTSYQFSLDFSGDNRSNIDREFSEKTLLDLKYDIFKI